MCGDDVDARCGVADDRLPDRYRGAVADQLGFEHVRDREAIGRVDPEPSGERELGVEVDGQDMPATTPPRGGQIGDCGRLPYSALLGTDPALKAGLLVVWG